MTFYSGFIAVIGCPNVGKSTLINRFIGQKVSIVSERSQTTRSRVHGVMTESDYQIIFIDTPGMHTPRTKLGEYMMRVAHDSIRDVDAILLMINAEHGVGARDKIILNELSGEKNVVVAVNKCDAAPRAAVMETLNALNDYPWLSEVVAISAKTGESVDVLKGLLKKFLPEGPKYYPDDMVTDQPERVIAAEIIREKALKNLREEIPHGVGVEILGIRRPEENALLTVDATIYCERASHKSIIIGKNGEMLKKIGSEARVELTRLFCEKIYLSLWVKVKPKWRNNLLALRDLGYYE